MIRAENFSPEASAQTCLVHRCYSPPDTHISHDQRLKVQQKWANEAHCLTTPFCSSPAWFPKIVLPLRLFKREESLRARSSCPASSNKWKNLLHVMKRTRPRRSVRVRVHLKSIGPGSFSAFIWMRSCDRETCVMSKKDWSNIFPLRNGTPSSRKSFFPSIVQSGTA